MIPVLFLAWYFPPVGGAGVQRSLWFARQLPEHGVLPLVIAGPIEQGSRWAPLDHSLSVLLPGNARIWRQERMPRSSLPDRLWQRATGEDRALRTSFAEHAIRAGGAAADEHRARAIYVTLGPYECLHAALALGDRLALPVIADLRDPWALDEMRNYGHRWQQRSDGARMRRQLARCAFVIANTPEALRRVRAFVPTLTPERSTCITNGFDADDFAAPASTPTRDDGRFRIVHAGYLHCDAAQLAERRSRLRRAALGGGRDGVDLWGRTHRYLLRALARLAVDAPELVARIELHLHGVLSEADHAETAASGVAEAVHAHGYQPHAATVAAMRAADLLFLPMQALADGARASIVPGKTYEYLASGRPILAAVPDGDARSFVREAEAGVTLAPDDVSGIATALRAFVQAGRQRDRLLAPQVARFERRHLAARLAEVVRAVAVG